MKFLTAALFLLLLAPPVAAAERRTNACVVPTGIDDRGEVGTISATLVDDLLASEPPFLWLRALGPLAALVQKRETPIAFRAAAWVGAVTYNAAAAFHPTALNVFGDIPSSEQVRRCQPDPSNSTALQEFRRHEEVALVYTLCLSFVALIPELEDTVRSLFADDFGIDYDLLLAGNDTSTSWGMSNQLVDQITTLAATDGWNSAGTLANPFNPKPFEDFSFTDSDGNEYAKYSPTSREFRPPSNVEWQPLLETDGRGFLLRQEHVTPFIGNTGRLIGLEGSTDEKLFRERTAGKPEDYGYTKKYMDEAKYVVDQTRQLATNETKKLLVEYFDSKFRSVAALAGITFLESVPNATSYDYWKFDAGLLLVTYQVVMLVWKEKVKFNRVRPTTVVQSLLEDQELESYAKINRTHESLMNGKYWEPYIRTMPHAEYPSASACLCQNSADYINTYIVGNLGETPITPAPAFFPAGSSTLEPGVTPAQDLTIFFNGWDEIAELCSESRLWGGMHFAGAVPAGQDLCRDAFVDVTIAKLNLLEDGNKGGALIDLNNDGIRVRSD